MKFSSQEEYGLRCLMAVGRAKTSITIPEISRREGLTEAYVAKLLMVLRKGDFICSTRGQTGGYALSRSPEEINVGSVMELLGGRLFADDFCEKHSGVGEVCTHESACALRPLWTSLQDAIDTVLCNLTLRDLLIQSKQAIKLSRTSDRSKLVEV